MAFSVVGMARRWAAERGDQPMMSHEGTTVTWSEFAERSNRVANGLAAEGVGSQDRVAFIDKNGPIYFDVLFGGAKVNAVNVAVNWRLAPPEMAYIVNDAEAKVLFVGSEFLDHLAKFEDQLETVRKIIVLDGDHPKHESYESWLAAQTSSDPGAEPAAGDVAMQLYTSGTTGLPKGVMLTNENLGALIPEGSKEMGIDEDTVNLVAMPLFHIGGSGWALVGMANGCHSVIMREVDPAAILDAIPRYRITHAFIVPAVIMLILATPACAETDFTSLQLITYGASPITVKVLTQALETFGCQFMQLYGLTETTGAITRLAPEDHDPENRPELLRSCGKPFPGVEMRVVDPDTGEDREPGVVGELWTRSGQNMKGYWHKDDETARTVVEGGWLRTGDAGYTDADGHIFLHDRVKDMIVSGGENVYPAEVENVLMSHDGVADVAVIGVPSEKWGETVKALVVRAPGSEVQDKELIAFAREQLAHFKCPTSVDFTDVLPRNPSGKILKRELREPFWVGMERRVH